MELLNNFPVNRLGSNFVVAVSHELVRIIMEVVSASLMAISFTMFSWLI
jgi:hypothetical protein